MLGDDINNRVGSFMAGSGRTGSGAHMAALGKGYAQGMAPVLFDWYTGQQDRQLGAAGAATGYANNAAGALGANEGARLATAQGAPGLLDATYSPYTQQLTSAGYGANLPYQRLGMLNDLIMPAASQFGSRTDLGSGFANQTGQSSSATEQASRSDTQTKQLTQTEMLNQLYNNNTGTGSTTGTSKTKVDPLMMALGAGTTLGSAYLGA
jgi:hypothetical protein